MVVVEEVAREKAIDKIRKMLAHSKSAGAIGSESEAHAFATKIQELLSKHKIQLSEVEYAKLDETDPVTMRWVDFESAGIQKKKVRIGWHERVADFTCEAYYCSFTVSTGSSDLCFIGRSTDIDAAEQVFLYLVRVASNLADREYVKYFHECKRAGDATKARGFRSSYLLGFATRLGERYQEEKERMREEAARTGLALVRLTDALVAVEAYLQKRRDAEEIKFARASSIKKLENLEGYRRGVSDAQAIPLGGRAKQVSS
jgi:uncharacterized protein DUF2786